MKASTSNIQRSTLNAQRAKRSTGRASWPIAHRSSRIAHRSSPAFTVVELLTVLTIIAILMGTILGVSKYALTNAATSRAKAEIAAMEMALESFKNDNGFYPPSTGTRSDAIDNSASLYAALAGIAPWTKQYFSFKPNQLKSSGTFTYIVDPFGSPYNYYQPGATNQATFDLWSYGPDGLNDTPDDIVNWRR